MLLRDISELPEGTICLIEDMLDMEDGINIPTSGEHPKSKDMEVMMRFGLAKATLVSEVRDEKTKKLITRTWNYKLSSTAIRMYEKYLNEMTDEREFEIE